MCRAYRQGIGIRLLCVFSDNFLAAFSFIGLPPISQATAPGASQLRFQVYLIALLVLDSKTQGNDGF